MSVPWLAQRERGSALAMRFMVWCTLALGRSAGRALLLPVCLYFAVFSVHARVASNRYLQRVLQRPVRFADIVRHYHTFAATIQDRVYLLSGRYEYFDVRLHGLEALDRALERGRGCMLLGSHLGSFEVLRARGTFEERAPINVLMHERNTGHLGRVLDDLNPRLKHRVINLGSPATLLRAKECLERGEMVGILGDRAIHGGRQQLREFLGAPAPMPEGPLLLASILDVPVFLFFGIYSGGRRYDIHVEPFADGLKVRRTHRSEDLAPWIARYVERLEHHCRLAPYNWFNFFDFWQGHAR